MADVEDHELQNAPERLKEFEEQLASVEAMLLDDPENEELLAIHAELTEVIELTRDLVQSEAADAAAGAPGQAASEREQHQQLVGPAGAASAAAGGAAPPSVSSLLPPQVAEQIRHAQQRAALAGQGPAEWAIGAKCRAVYSGDGNWYNAVVQGVGAGGGFVVLFDGYGTQEEVGKDAVELRPATDEEGGYKGVAAPKRRRVDDSVEIQEMPKWLQVKETDDEKTRAKKRKLAKSYKSKARFAKLDLQQKEKAEAWKRFVTGKSGKKGKKK